MKNNSRPSLAAFMNSDINKELNSKPEFMLLQSGYANGYVAIPPSHPDYSKNLMDDESIIVHGGVTFCESFRTCKKKFKSIEFIEKNLPYCGDTAVRVPGSVQTYRGSAPPFLSSSCSDLTPCICERAMFPAVTIKYEYADEDASYNTGSYIIHGDDVPSSPSDELSTSRDSGIGTNLLKSTRTTTPDSLGLSAFRKSNTFATSSVAPSMMRRFVMWFGIFFSF